jgi:hypothetical protein
MISRKAVDDNGCFMPILDSHCEFKLYSVQNAASKYKSSVSWAVEISPLQQQSTSDKAQIGERPKQTRVGTIGVKLRVVAEIIHFNYSLSTLEYTKDYTEYKV